MAAAPLLSVETCLQGLQPSGNTNARRRRVRQNNLDPTYQPGTACQRQERPEDDTASDVPEALRRRVHQRLLFGSRLALLTCSFVRRIQRLPRVRKPCFRRAAVRGVNGCLTREQAPAPHESIV